LLNVTFLDVVFKNPLEKKRGGRGLDLEKYRWGWKEIEKRKEGVNTCIL